MKIKYCTNFPSFAQAVLGKEGARELARDGKATRDMMKQYPLDDIRRWAVVEQNGIVFLVPKEQVEKINKEIIEKAIWMSGKEGLLNPIEIQIMDSGEIILC